MKKYDNWIGCMKLEDGDEYTADGTYFYYGKHGIPPSSLNLTMITYHAPGVYKEGSTYPCFRCISLEEWAKLPSGISLRKIGRRIAMNALYAEPLPLP